jgi:hypothetical protein
MNQFAANTIIDMAKLVFREAGSSTHQLQQMAANANNSQLSGSGIPSKYWKALRSLSRVCKKPYFICRLLTTV